MSDTFQIIGGYDLRRSTSTIAARDAHAMVRESNKRAGITKPRAPKSRSLQEISDRAGSLGVEIEIKGKEITLFPPKFNELGERIGNNHGDYYTTTQKAAWQTLDEIAVEIVKAKSDDAIATESEQAISDLLPPVVTICETVAKQACQELLPVDPWEQRRQERITAQGALTADDFASTYTRHDDFGDDAFVFSARYGYGALI
jgi:hypothetical protein